MFSGRWGALQLAVIFALLIACRARKNFLSYFILAVADADARALALLPFASWTIRTGAAPFVLKNVCLSLWDHPAVLLASRCRLLAGCLSHGLSVALSHCLSLVLSVHTSWLPFCHPSSAPSPGGLPRTVRRAPSSPPQPENYLTPAKGRLEFPESCLVTGGHDYVRRRAVGRCRGRSGESGVADGCDCRRSLFWKDGAPNSGFAGTGGRTSRGKPLRPLRPGVRRSTAAIDASPTELRETGTWGRQCWLVGIGVTQGMEL